MGNEIIIAFIILISGILALVSFALWAAWGACREADKCDAIIKDIRRRQNGKDA